MRILILVTTLIAGTALWAAEEPYTFQAWKEQQVLEAQNQVLRISARMSHLKSGKKSTAAGGDTAGLPSSRVKKAETDTVASAERELRRAQESLQTANTLTMDEYISVYLPTLQANPDAIQALSQKLSKDELAEIFRGFMKRDPTTTDTKRNNVSAISLPR